LLAWANQRAKIFNITSKTSVQSLSPRFDIRKAFLSKSRKYLIISAYRQFNIYQYEKIGEKESYKLYKKVQNHITNISWSNNEEKILGWNNNHAFVWNIDKWSQKHFPHFIKLNGSCWIKDNEEILTWGKDGTAVIWDIQTLQSVNKYLSKITCEGMYIANVKGLSKKQYISFLNKGAIMPMDEIRNNKLKLQTRLELFSKKLFENKK